MSGTRPDLLIAVVGTGTEVGKTWVSAHLLRDLRAEGHRVAARKPAVPAIAPGKAAGRRVTADGRAAQGNSKVTLRARIR